MAKITTDDIKALGFIQEIFGLSDASEFDAMLQNVIDEESAVIAGLLGSLYNTESDPDKTYIKQLEKVSVAAELLQRRINRILSNVSGSGEEISTAHERKQRDDYLKQREQLFDTLLGDTNFATGALVTESVKRVEVENA